MIPFLMPGRRPAAEDGITICLDERLGNQLFHYATGLAVARRLGVPAYFNLGSFAVPRSGRSFRAAFELGDFDTGVRIPDNPAFHRPVFLGLPSVPAAHLWHNMLAGRIPHFHPRVFMERSFTYDPAIERVQPGTTIVGHFQSYKYFDAISAELRERVAGLHAPSPWFREMTRRLTPGSGSVVLNVRRGDYLLPENRRVQGLATRDFYARCLQTARGLGYDGEVHVVSDSLELAMSELSGLAELHPIDPPTGTSPVEIMLVIARADALAVANSSFSWWAGYLGERPDRTVFAPRPWLADSAIDTRDLLPPGWLTYGNG